MTMVIRSAESGDRADCLRLLDVLSGGNHDPDAGRAFDALLDQSRGLVLVAEDAVSASLVGMASVSFNVAMRYGGEYCQLEELVVDSAARGKNLGGLLMEEMLARAQERSCAEVGVYLVATTEGNRAFYEKYGFVAVGTEMRRSLQPA